MCPLMAVWFSHEKVTEREKEWQKKVNRCEWDRHTSPCTAMTTVDSIDFFVRSEKHVGNCLLATTTVASWPSTLQRPRGPLSSALPVYEIHLCTLTLSELWYIYYYYKKGWGKSTVCGKWFLFSNTHLTTSNNNISLGSCMHRDLRLFSNSWILNQAPSLGNRITTALVHKVRA